MPNPNELMGWVKPTPSQQKAVLSELPIPYMSDVYSGIKDSGRNKVRLLCSSVKKLNGSFIAQIQSIGDCFIGSTKVLMADGTLKAIEDIRVGDLVISANNNICKVTNTIRKNYQNDLYEIKAKGWESSLICTEDHQFLLASKNKRSNPNNQYWKPINKVSITKDRVVLPFGFQSTENQNFGKFKLNSELAYLIGLYLAEGSNDYGKITFSLNINEEFLADEIIEICYNNFGKKAVKYYHKSEHNVLIVCLHSVEISDLFRALIPGNVLTKSVPISIIQSSKLVRLSCIKGWIAGDGCGTKGNSIIGVSSSYSLIESMRQLCLSCGLNPRINTRKKADHQNIAARQLCIYGQDVQLFPKGQLVKTARKLNNKAKNGFIRNIEYINKIHNENTIVYCIEVENDHSFIAEGYAVHNCVSFGSAHAVDHTYAFEILVKQEAEEWLGITSTEDIYGGSRVQVGNGQLGGGDGSLGSWAAKYVSQYGTLLRKKYDHDDLSVYSGERAKRWGNPGQGTPSYLIPIAKQTRIQTVTLVRSYNEARDSIYNGYAVTVASNVGFGSKRDKDGFLRPAGSWAHQMCFIGADDEYYRKGLLCLNSWPYQWVNGPQRYEMPPGSFWVDADVADRMLGQGDSFAYSDRLGFEAKKLDLRKWV